MAKSSSSVAAANSAGLALNWAQWAIWPICSAALAASPCINQRAFGVGQLMPIGHIHRARGPVDPRNPVHFRAAQPRIIGNAQQHGPTGARAETHGYVSPAQKS